MHSFYFYTVQTFIGVHNNNSHMTSCDNHETSTSFTSTKMKEKRKNVRFKLSAKTGPKAQFCRKKSEGITKLGNGNWEAESKLE